MYGLGRCMTTFFRMLLVDRLAYEDHHALVDNRLYAIAGLLLHC